MKILFVFISLLLLLLSSCSGTGSGYYHSESYINILNRSALHMEKAEYKKFLEDELVRKEGALQALEEIEKRENTHYSEAEQRERSFSSDDHTLYNFKKITQGIELKRIDLRKKRVQREVFDLKSRLSSLENR